MTSQRMLIVASSVKTSSTAVAAIRHQDHVGLVDALPAGDRRAVEHLAVVEEVLVDGARRNGHVLFLAVGVGETQVDELDFFFLDQARVRQRASLHHPPDVQVIEVNFGGARRRLAAAGAARSRNAGQQFCCGVSPPRPACAHRSGLPTLIAHQKAGAIAVQKSCQSSGI